MLTKEDIKSIVEESREREKKGLYLDSQFETEIDLLKRFVNGNIIQNKSEYEILKKYASSGFINFSFQFTGKPSAKITRSGLDYLSIVR